MRQKRIKFGLKWIKKEKNITRGRRRRDEVANADEEEIESWLHRPVGALLPRNSDEAFNFFFLS